MTEKILQRLNKQFTWFFIIGTTLSIFRCFFTLLNARKAYHKYYDAKNKKVVSNICLRTINYEGLFYTINLFSIKSVLDAKTIKCFKNYADSIPGYQIRSEAEAVFGVFQLNSPNVFLSCSQHIIRSLQKQFEGTYIVAMTSKSEKFLDIPYVIYFYNDRAYRVIICQDSLNKLCLK